MIKRLFDFLSRKTQAASDDRQIEDVSEQKAALAEFLPLVTRGLAPDTSGRIAQRITASFDEALEDIVYGGAVALRDGIDGEEGQQGGQWLMIHVDWRDAGEVEWQVNEILATRDHAERWTWEGTDRDRATVMEALQALSQWLKQHGLALVHIDTGGDEYVALIVDKEIEERVVALGKQARLNVMTYPEFVVTQEE